MVNDSAAQFSPKSIDETSLRRFIAITVHSVQELAILRCERCFSVTRTLLPITCWAIAASFYLFSIPKSLWLNQADYLFVVHLFCRLFNHCWNVLIPVLPPFNYHSIIIIFTPVLPPVPSARRRRRGEAHVHLGLLTHDKNCQVWFWGKHIQGFTIQSLPSCLFRIWKVYSLKGIESSRVLNWTYL